jgi:pimeloyl-ACP methyl ester carboxylesterase
MKNKEYIFESLYIKINDIDTLHLKHICRVNSKETVIMIHGSIENGKVFYSKSGKGLAWYLAKKGYDVYVADFRGRGQSVPAVNSESTFSQTDIIKVDIPAIMNFIKKRKGNIPQIWVAHSWGGVLLNSHLARYPKNIKNIKKIVTFGTKRCVRAFNFQKILYLNIIWNFLCKKNVKKNGFLNAKEMNLGSDNESKGTHKHCVIWAKPSPWIDPEDKFDYGKAIKDITLPPALYIAATNDKALGHIKDVRDFIEESGRDQIKLKIIGKKYGTLHNYDHINMLTHGDCGRDHFIYIFEWLEK